MLTKGLNSHNPTTGRNARPYHTNNQKREMKNNATLVRFLVLAALGGSSLTLIKVSLQGLTPSQPVLSRLVLSALLLIGITLISKVALPRTAEVRGHLASRQGLTHTLHAARHVPSSRRSA